MRQQVLTVFDEFVPGTTPVYTSAQFNAVLGSADQFAIHAIVDNISGTSPTFGLTIEQSGDGRNWMQRNDQQSTPAAAADIAITLSSTFHQKFFSDGASGAVSNATPWGGNNTPLLPFVRFKIALGGTSPGAHVKVHVALRGPR